MLEWQGKMIAATFEAEVNCYVTNSQYIKDWSGNGTITSGVPELGTHKTNIGEVVISKISLGSIPCYFEFGGSGKPHYY